MHPPHSRRPGTRDTAARPRSTPTPIAPRSAAVIVALTFSFAFGALAAYASTSSGGCKGKKPCSSSTTSTSSTAASTTTTSSGTGSATTAGGRHILAYYYLWWSYKHWHDKLGSNYPYTLSPLALPATVDSSGCNPVSLYSGDQLTDVPAALWSQDDPGVIENDVRTAAKAGLAGFIVNDLAYLVRQYGNDPAYDHSYSNRPILLWTGSRKYSAAAVKTISDLFRSAFFIVGDETLTTWTDGRSAYLDGDSYYWSSQNPYTNPGSFTTLQKLAATVRSSGANPDGSSKLWFAPLTPGYDSILLGGSTCVPRYGTQTLDRLFAGNSQSNPDGWTLISWNEIAEGTYVLPLQRWETTYLAELKALAGS